MGKCKGKRRELHKKRSKIASFWPDRHIYVRWGGDYRYGQYIPLSYTLIYYISYSTQGSGGENPVKFSRATPQLPQSQVSTECQRSLVHSNKASIL